MPLAEHGPETGATRAAVVVATTGVGMLVAAVLGAFLLFAPGDVDDATGRSPAPGPSTAAADEQPGDVTVEDDATVASAPRTPRTPRHTVATVPPAAAPTPTAHPPVAARTRDRPEPRRTPTPPRRTRDPRDDRDGRGWGHHGYGGWSGYGGHDGDRRDRDGDHRDRGGWGGRDRH